MASSLMAELCRTASPPWLLSTMKLVQYSRTVGVGPVRPWKHFTHFQHKEWAEYKPESVSGPTMVSYLLCKSRRTLCTSTRKRYLKSTSCDQYRKLKRNYICSNGLKPPGLLLGSHGQSALGIHQAALIFGKSATCTGLLRGHGYKSCLSPGRNVMN